MLTPEELARENIDALLEQCGWAVRNQNDANILAHLGLAIRNFSLKSSHGFVNNVLDVDGRAAGVFEARKEGATPTDVEAAFHNPQETRPDPQRSKF